MAEPQSIADVLAQSSQWEKVKAALNQAVGQGIGRWVLGPGNPDVVSNPLRALTAPGKSYSPANYQGIGNMGRRLRLTEDEASPPMTALKTAVTQNPLLKDVQVEVGRRKGAPKNVTGSINWRQGQPPLINLSPVVSPTTDPGMVLVHEAVGHGSHGRVVGGTPEVDKELVAPRREGLATGAEKGIYGPLGLALPSGYEDVYGNRSDYKAAQEQGESLAQRVLQSGEVPPQGEVIGAMFQNKNSWPVKQATVATGRGS